MHLYVLVRTQLIYVPICLESLILTNQNFCFVWLKENNFGNQNGIVAKICAVITMYMSKNNSFHNVFKE